MNKLLGFIIKISVRLFVFVIAVPFFTALLVSPLVLTKDLLGLADASLLDLNVMYNPSRIITLVTQSTNSAELVATLAACGVVIMIGATPSFFLSALYWRYVAFMCLLNYGLIQSIQFDPSKYLHYLSAAALSFGASYLLPWLYSKIFRGEARSFEPAFLVKRLGFGERVTGTSVLQRKIGER